MTLKHLVLAFVVAVAACSGSTPPPNPDAKSIDAPAAGAFGATCTTVSDTSTECTSHVCTNTFNMIPHPVCSQKCTTLGGIDPTCPNGSMGMKCNQQGYCRP